VCISNARPVNLVALKKPRLFISNDGYPLSLLQTQKNIELTPLQMPMIFLKPRETDSVLSEPRLLF